MAADVLVLGAGGTFGHLAASILAQHHQLVGSVRKLPPAGFKPGFPVVVFDVCDREDAMITLLRRLKPGGLVINAVAVLASELKSDTATDRMRAITVNSLFPNRLAVAACELALRVLHISTDAVFPQMSGTVNETDEVGPGDYYGITKAAGELRGKHCVTLRCSIIGPPAPGHHRGLWAWVAGQPHGAKVRGYTNQQWRGLTTHQLALACLNLVDKEAFGELRREAPVHHAVPNPAISKFALVRALSLTLRPDLTVEPAEADQTVSRVLTSRYKVLDRYIPHFADWSDAIKSASEAIH